VAIERLDVLSDQELKALLRKSYDMVVEKLPKRVRAQLGALPPPATRPKKSPGKKRR
jgi:hypothetical protein